MRQRLRALERTLVEERAHVVVSDLALEFIDAWEEACANRMRLPDELDLVRAIARRGIPILTTVPLTSYIDRCRTTARVPDLDRLTECIVNGHKEMRMFAS